MKKSCLKIFTLVLCVVQAVIFMTSCSIFPEEEEPEIPALKTPKPVEYSFYTVKKGTLKSASTGTGKVTSIYYTEHSFEQSGGKFKEIHVALGDYVRKGDILFEIENSEIEDDYIEAEIQYKKMQLQFDEQSRKYKNGSISKTEYEIAELELKGAELKYNDLKESYENTVLYAKVSGKVVYINSAYTSASATTEIAGGDTIIAIDSEDPKYTYVVFEKTYISGDVNSDGDLNNKDLALLMQSLNQWEVTINSLASDVNADGSVNNKDYALLMQYHNNWDVLLK